MSYNISMKRLYTNKKYNFISNDVQKNLKNIYKRFGKKFNIKVGKFDIPIKLYKHTSKYSDKQNYNFIMEYDIEKRTSELKPFMITFYDEHLKAKNNVTYINNIHKTDNISGSDMVNIVLKIQKFLGVEKTALHDGASIKCNENIALSLSFFKLIEKNRTFYQKFGFEFPTENIMDFFTNIFGSGENIIKLLNQQIKKFKQITVESYVKKQKQLAKMAFKIMLENGYDNVEMMRMDWFDNYILTGKKHVNDDITAIITNVSELIKITSKHKEKYLYKLLIKLLNEKKCEDYSHIINMIVYDNLYMVKYKNKKIYIPYIETTKIIMSIKDSSRYVYVFK